MDRRIEGVSKTAMDLGEETICWRSRVRGRMLWVQIDVKNFTKNFYIY